MSDTLIDYDALESLLAVPFNDRELIREALTHRSYLNENKECTWRHNERLEFLGDAVLELVVTDHLFREYPEKAEGDLTSFRAALVNATTLAKIADKAGINDFLLLSKGEAKDTGKARQYILANALEAVIGAIYLDQGYEAARSFIAHFMFDELTEIIEKGLWKDPKSLFQERAQELSGYTPRYEVLKEDGPDHDKEFLIGVYLGAELVARGEGKSKQEAEQSAATKGLEHKAWDK